MRPRRGLLALGIGLALAAALGAEPSPTPGAEAWLGQSPSAVMATQGPPAELFPHEVAPGRWQVVAFWADRSYAFFWQNRVWQVRYDRQWTGQWQGVAMGMPRTEAETLLGPPLVRTDTESLWELPHQTFPRRLRLVFTEGAVSDLYVYRSEL